MRVRERRTEAHLPAPDSRALPKVAVQETRPAKHALLSPCSHADAETCAKHSTLDEPQGSDAESAEDDATKSVSGLELQLGEKIQKPFQEQKEGRAWKVGYEEITQ